MDELLCKLIPLKQEHILQFWDGLNEDERISLAKQVNELNFEYILKCFDECMREEVANATDNDLEPVPPEVFGCFASTDSQTLLKYELAGLEEIGANKISCLLLAGGQGTRLGVNYPKGMYDVGLPSNKSLYHIMAQRILKLQQIASQRSQSECIIPWYIMTSEQTSEPTRDYLKLHAYFGLEESNVIIFEQNTIPCMTFDGKIIMQSKSSIAKAPDGNGGLYSALDQHGILADMEQRGVSMVHVHGVDNILVKMADPIFIGFCLAKKAHCGVKVVAKSSPTEAVGVVCKLGGRYHIVEYSEISMETAQRRRKDGQLMFNAGGIANHFFTTTFLGDVVKSHNSKLRHHVARKKIAFCNEAGLVVSPTQPNGIKMEKFVFDVFEFTNDFAVWEVLREDEFAPLKNADSMGKDSPTTARLALYDLHHRWIVNAGATVINLDSSAVSNIPSADCNGSGVKKRKLSQSGDSDENMVVCEVSPLLSYSGEGLEELVRGKSLVQPVVLYALNELQHHHKAFVS